MRRGEPNLAAEMVRQRAEKRREAIVAKCHSAIFDVAQLWKESIQALKALPADSPQEIKAAIYARVDNGLEEMHRKYSGPVQPESNRFAAQVIFSDAALTAKSDVRGVIEAIHFNRHKVPLKADMKKSEARNWNASRRILRTASDVERLRCGKGPIQPFQGDMEHSDMFQVLWGFGIERLTAEELADFFDSYCPCGSEHDPDALKKQRARFQKALDESIAATAL